MVKLLLHLFVFKQNLSMLKLMTYKTQLLQINRALVEDPTNSGLLRLKKSLEKMVEGENNNNSENLKYVLKPLSSTEAAFAVAQDHASPSRISDKPINYTTKSTKNQNITNTIDEVVKNFNPIKKPVTKTENKSYKKPEYDIYQPSVSRQYNNENQRDEFEIPIEESLKSVEEFIAREKELSKWRIGENCFALWKGNGNYYTARIEAISPTGQVLIVYDTYEVKDEVYYLHMHKFTGRKCTLADKANMKKPGKFIQKSVRHDLQSYKKGLSFSSNSIPVCKRNERLRQQNLIASVVQNN